MKKLFLMGRSEAGKTSLTQALKGEELHYEKTQYTITADDTIDSPGEYASQNSSVPVLHAFLLKRTLSGSFRQRMNHTTCLVPVCARLSCGR